jgi:fatty acid desaturase
MQPAAADTAEALPSFTLAQVRVHDNEESCWIIYRERVYDATAWLSKHPGGVKRITEVSGADCTLMFEVYHPLGMERRLVQECKLLGTVSDAPVQPPLSPFYRSLKQQVESMLRKEPRSTSRTGQQATIALVLLGLVLSWVWNVFFATHAVFVVISALLLGFWNTHTLLCIGHDASHGAMYFPNFLGEACTGYSKIKWNYEHNIGHHFLTNVKHWDIGIGKEGSPVRLAPLWKWLPVNRLQAILLPALTPVLVLRHRLKDVLYMALPFKGHAVSSVRAPTMYQRLSYFAIAFCHIGWRLLLPLYLGAPHPWATLMISEMVMGVYAYNVFAVSHLFEGASFSEDLASMPDDWALHILRTTLDYDNGSRLTRMLTGSLNLQVAHHMFPTLPQDRYPAITRIIEEQCKRFGYKYFHASSFWQALRMHHSHIASLGSPAVHFP